MMSLQHFFDNKLGGSLHGTSELSELTQALLNAGLSEQDIRLVMGENMQSFLLANLPD
jgi:microsomal dipeptidase-like Zn-dependent dipeptidase